MLSHISCVSLPDLCILFPQLREKGTEKGVKPKFFSQKLDDQLAKEAGESFSFQWTILQEGSVINLVSLKAHFSPLQSTEN